MLRGNMKPPTYNHPTTQIFNSLGHTTISGTRPIFPSLRAKISCKQCPGRKHILITNTVHSLLIHMSILQIKYYDVRGNFGFLTMSTKHPIFWVMREGDTRGFDFLHEGLVQCRRLYSTGVENGLKTNNVVVSLAVIKQCVYSLSLKKQ